MQETKIKITINNKEFSVPEGEFLLNFCKKEDLPVPALCNHPDFSKSEAVCRLCLVKVKLPKEKSVRMLPSCFVKAVEGMSVVTEDAELVRIRKTILELLFLEHAGLCHNCYRNLNCELQTLAIKHTIDQFRFVPRVAEIESEDALERLRDRLTRRVVDVKNTSIARDNAKCVECRRCIKTCSEIQDVKALGLQKRGIQMGVGTEYNTPLECTYCGQCALHCPTAAIVEKTEMSSVVKALKEPHKIIIAQVAPSVAVTLGEEFGMLPGSIVAGKMVTALKKCGFKSVFDSSVGSDMAIMEETTELIDRITKENRNRPLPLITGSCPASVLFIEQNYPELLSYLASTRSTQMIMGTLLKTYYAEKYKTDPKNIVVVSIVSCTANKYEASRPEFVSKEMREVDYVITVRELAHIIKNLKIPFSDLVGSEFDSEMGEVTGSGVLTGVAGGFAEAVIRSASHYLTKKGLSNLEFKELRKPTQNLNECSVKVGDKKIRIGVVSGLAEIRKVIKMVVKKESPYDFIELRACPGGCIAGGGQSYPINNEIRKNRANSIYSLDKEAAIRESNKNPLVEKMYREFFYQAGGRKAEKLLHTKHYPFEYKLRKAHMLNK